MSKRWVYELLLFRLHSLNLETRVASNHVGPVNIYHRGRGGAGGGRRVCLGRITWFFRGMEGGQLSLTGYKGEGGGGAIEIFFQ